MFFITLLFWYKRLLTSVAESLPRFTRQMEKSTSIFGSLCGGGGGGGLINQWLYMFMSEMSCQLFIMNISHLLKETSNTPSEKQERKLFPLYFCDFLCTSGWR